jgi:hypothetical protein
MKCPLPPVPAISSVLRAPKNSSRLTSNPLPSNGLRTLSSLETNGPSPTPAPSITCALFPERLTPCSPKNPSISFPFTPFRTLARTIASCIGPSNERNLFSSLLITLFQISPIIATLTKNTRGTGGCAYKPLPKKWGLRVPSHSGTGLSIRRSLSTACRAEACLPASRQALAKAGPRAHPVSFRLQYPQVPARLP